jgi:membrane-associated protease RseP (regulator of RpoE activity)
MMKYRNRFTVWMALVGAAVAGGPHGRGLGGGIPRPGAILPSRGLNLRLAQGHVPHLGQGTNSRSSQFQKSQRDRGRGQGSGSSQGQGSDDGTSSSGDASSSNGGGSYDDPVTPAQGRFLGVNQQAVIDPEGRRGIQIVNVSPGSAAERAGLEPGDVILSANGYATTEVTHLPWIISNAMVDDALRLNVRNVRDGLVYSIAAQIP